MSEENGSVLEKLAIVSRYLLVALFAAALASGWFGASSDRAFAAAPVGAAPSCLSCTMKAAGNSKLYITDTNKKVICVYSLNGESLRLVSARKYDFDSRIVDGSMPVHGKALDGIAATREAAQSYVKGCQPELDKLSKKIGQQIGGE